MTFLVDLHEEHFEALKNSFESSRIFKGETLDRRGSYETTPFSELLQPLSDSAVYVVSRFKTSIKYIQLRLLLGGLSPTRNVTIAKQVAMFLSVLSHHTKNRIVKHSFKLSGYTVSKHFNSVLNSLLKLHPILLINPQPVPDDCNDNRWKYFKGCLGALDGTYIPVKVLATDIPRYRNRKGFVSVNVLAVCDRNINYIYVLSGWEGSAADSRVLRDAVTREHGLKNYIILGCCLLHNFIRTYIDVDSMEDDVPEFDNEVDGENTLVEDFINAVEPSHAWTSWRDNLVMQIMNGKKADKGSSHMRVWAYDEEKVLVNSLKELVTRGYKCDNGFRSGYVTVLEQMMLQAFPNTDLRGDPHINSKMHVWKKQYVALHMIFDGSGIGLNASYMRDNTVRSLKNKSFPFNNDWIEIFGKDLATGENATAFHDAAQNVTNTGGKTSQPVGSNPPPETELFNESSQTEFQSSVRGESSSGTDKKGKKKRKLEYEQTDGCLMDTVNSFCDKTTESISSLTGHMGELSERIGADYDAAKKRSMVYEELGQFMFLTLV
ncbi:hypothetical protein ACS0TY_020068 [Phlomoides rotata]